MPNEGPHASNMDYLFSEHDTHATALLARDNIFTDLMLRGLAPNTSHG